MAPAAPSADDDERDVVVLVDGDELTGRVERPFGAEHLVMIVKGKRREIPRSEVRSTSTVRARLANWLELVDPGLDADRNWELVELASAARLDHMAKLQAYRVLLADPDHEEAHAFLDHKGKPGKWRWRLDGKLVSSEKFAEEIRDRKSPLVLRSEHYEVHCDGGLERTLDAAFDLERLYAIWMDEIGSGVDAREMLEPMTVRVHADLENFRPATQHGGPNFEPGYLLGSTREYESSLETYLDPNSGRAVRLIDTGVQQLIYNTVLGRKLETIARDTSAYRECPILEVGLGDWYERRWEGDPGYGAAGAWRPDRAAAELALRRANSEPLASARHELTNLIHVTWNRLMNVDRDRAALVAKCRTFVAFLMEDGAVLPTGGPARTRDAVVDLLRTVYGVPTGNSSTAWDDVFVVVPIEELELAWKGWLTLLP